MAANAVSNDNLKNYRDDQGTTGFTPGVNYTYDASAKEVDVSDGSVFPSGVSLLKTLVRVCDKFGGEVRGTITNPNGSESGDDRTATIDVSSLDASKGLDMMATVIGDDGHLIADGGAYGLQTAGSLSSWDAQKNA